VASGATRTRTARDTFLFPVLVFLGVAAVLFVTIQVSHDHLSPEGKPLPTDLSERDSWYSGWLQYDTGWYVYLAEHGYDANQKQAFDAGQQSGIAYFPAYPLTVRAVARTTGADYADAAMWTTFACGFGFVLLFWVWCRDRLSKTARRTALVLLLVYPYGWFLYGSGYGDSLFLFASIGAFVLLERDRPALAGLAGFVATAARPTGMAVFIGLVAVALERRGVLVRDATAAEDGESWWARERARWQFHGDKLQTKDAGVLLAVGGFVAFVVFCATQFGDPFAFATVQKAPGWDQGAGFHTWFKAGFFGHVLHGSPSFAIRLVVQAVFTLAFLLGSLLVLRRFGWGYAVYTLVTVAIPLLGTGDFQGMGRYLLECFPVFAVAGDWLAKPQRLRLRRTSVIVSGLGLLILASLFGRSYYLT
jgi:hypothetical protein